ncbi:hypothetical protein [Pseudomonas sp. 6D_7.1_Bac1]|uniref:hypothetical protein n=1 Tax=Pseudomonas sp. 6D_7.1_Bac1 TaxID=2971615 RepID=UPI0021C93329|nr:hypothetical protein [Pseudomonas sp. 6D_7.1_Bac1]MCU1752969.1 hypothetical protein [Pseudomonas sp. 6D_7.1_Bac1]
MPYRPPARRTVSITLNPLQLIASIAVGLWLGFLAIALTCWLLSKLLSSEQLAPLAEATRQITQPKPAPVYPAPENPMFEQYKENLRKQAQQQTLDQARSNPRNLSNPKCQFWLQQDQTAPSEKSRTNVLQFCD